MRALTIVKLGQGAPPSSCQYLPPSSFSSHLFYLQLSSKIPFPPLQMPCQVSVRSVLLCCVPPHRSFLPEAFGWAGSVPTPPTASLAGRSLIPHVHAQHPLLPPVFSRFGLVLTPQLSHKFSHLCLQTSLLSSKRRIKRIKRDEI